MYSNPSILNSLLPLATDAVDATDAATRYATRLTREQFEGAERAQRERVEQASELNTPAVRIRAWERLHRLALPREAAHAVLDVVATATRLTLEQVREEQRRRSEPATAGSETPATLDHGS